MRKRRKIALVVALAVLVVGPYLSADYFSKSGAPRFLTAPVIRADLEDAVLAMGTLQASRQVDVGTRVTGQLRSLKVHLGEHVRKDQLLAEIDPILPENELRSAEAHRQNLEAQQRATAARLCRAELEFRRQRQLIRTDATAKQTLDVAEADVRVQEAELAALAAQINQASVQVDTAKVNLAYTRITAPIDGDVVAIVTQEGQTVVAAQLVPVLLKLADLDTMTVKAQVSEADVIRIRVGQAVYFTIMRDPDNRYYGTLRAIEPALKGYAESSSTSATSSAASTGNISSAVFYNALFDVANTDHQLRIGMTAQVSIVLAEAKQILTIPSAALSAKREQGTYEVRVLGANGAVESRKIRVGINNNVNLEVRDGLREEDTVITGEATQGPGASVAPGMM